MILKTIRTISQSKPAKTNNLFIPLSDRLDKAIITIDKTADRQAQSCPDTSQRGSTGQR